MTKYLLDANIFIQAKNLHYGFDFCPAFWQWLEEQNAAGKVASIDKVADELYAGDDTLTEWAKSVGKTFFLSADQPVVEAMTDVSVWSKEQNYTPSALSTFLQVADCWIIAYAKAHEWTVVTHERPEFNKISKIKIPEVCIGLDIECIDPYAMLRRERARFILGPAKNVA